MDLADSLEILWKATKGEGISKKSALDLLQLTEEIYWGLEEGRAFDIDLSEYEEEGDEEKQ